MQQPLKVRAVGAATPALRLPAAAVDAGWGRRGGRGTSAVCAADEDTLTLSWQAAVVAIEAAGIRADEIDGLWWGTTRAPFAEGPSHAYLASALGLHAGIGGALTTGSPHSGIEALLGAWDAVAAGSAGTALVIASDALVPSLGSAFEAHCGAAAVALVVALDGGSASLTVRRQSTQPVLDRYRGDTEAETREMYDSRLFREEAFVPIVTAMAEQLGAPQGTRWSLPDPDGRMGRSLARRITDQAPVSVDIRAELGDTGAAASLLGALPALGAPGPLGVITYAAGRCTGVLAQVDSAVPGAHEALQALSGGREASYTEVLRARRQLAAGGETVEMAVPPGGAQFVRGNPEMLGLLGARCAECGTVNTPPSIHPVCIACGGEKLEPVALSRKGAVHTFVVNYTMPAPFEAPLPLVVVDLDDGARVMLQGVAPGDGIEIGAEVRLVLRRYTVERGVPVYGYKAEAITTDSAGPQGGD